MLGLLGETAAFACSGTVLFDAEGGTGKSHVSVKKGERLSGFDHVLRDRQTSDVVVCNRKHCYPAFALDQDKEPQEIIRLEGCKISENSSNEGDLERHKVGTLRPKPTVVVAGRGVAESRTLANPAIMPRRYRRTRCCEPGATSDGRRS